MYYIYIYIHIYIYIYIKHTHIYIYIYTHTANIASYTFVLCKINSVQKGYVTDLSSQ